MSETQPPVDPQAAQASLSRELSEFLLELSIGVHRYAMYPPDHPSLRPAAESILNRLGILFLDKMELSIGVAREQLVIEGVATESKHPVLRDLSRRLHGHQLGALSISKGVNAEEIQGLLGALSLDSKGEDDPLGLLPPEEIPTWDHVRLFPLGYDRLELKDQGEEGGTHQPKRATLLWLGLARAAMATDDPEQANESTDARSIASSIKSHEREEAYDQAIVGYLLQLADELKTGTESEAEAIRKRVSTLVHELDESTLERLVSMGGDTDQRRKFVLDANQSLAVDSVMKIVDAAATASQQTISHSLTRLMSKLSLHASSGAEKVRDRAETALRDNVEELLKDWELTDPNPDQYTAILDSMANAAPVFQREDDDQERGLAGPRRVLKMSLEVDTWGPTVAKAVSEIINAGRLGYLLKMAESAEPDSTMAKRLRVIITDPENLRRLLAESDVNETTLGRVVAYTGLSAIPTLLEAITESESRKIRRKVFDALVEVGQDVGGFIPAYLADQRWYVLRNMLALIRKLPAPPDGFSPGPFLDHEDHRVRREAIPLALKDPDLRRMALSAGFAVEDEALLRVVLLDVQESLPETLVPAVVNRVIRSERSGDLRAMGVRALRESRATLTLEVLLEVIIRGKTLFGRPKLADPTPEVLASLEVLATSWRNHPQAAKVLRVAGRSKDPRIKEAVSLNGGVG